LVTPRWLVEDGLVLDNMLVGPDMGRIIIEAPRVTEAARAGHFVMIRAWEGEPLLPRAMAPLRYAPEQGWMEVYYRIKGSGTVAMSRASKGAPVHVSGPLGVPITQSFYGKTVALVGRGVGITPLLPLAEHVLDTGGRVRAYLSSRTRDYLFGYERFREIGEVSRQVDDEDGGGFRVTDSLVRGSEDGRVDAIYVCGSRRLLRHAHEIGARREIPAYVFLEEKMGCGTGFCKGCPVRLRNGKGYRLVCTDGPLFSTGEIALA
jgi:dihydroorotate dehydrogenase electron transfer subunit